MAGVSEPELPSQQLRQLLANIDVSQTSEELFQSIQNIFLYLKL